MKRPPLPFIPAETSKWLDRRWCVLRGSGCALAPQDEAVSFLHERNEVPSMENTHVLILRCSIAERSSLEGRTEAGPGHSFTSSLYVDASEG